MMSPDFQMTVTISRVVERAQDVSHFSDWSTLSRVGVGTEHSLVSFRSRETVLSYRKIGEVLSIAHASTRTPDG